MDKVTVLVCRTNEAAEVVEIPNNMGGVQTLLGADDLEEITPWTKDVVVVFSSKAQANPSNLNRRLYAEDGTPVITVHGDFIMALMPHGCKEFLPIPSMYVDRYGKFMEVIGDGEKTAELERPTTKPPRLKVGKRYKFTPIVSNPGKTKGKFKTNTLKMTPPFLGTVLEEYAAFYLVVTPGGYRTTILKNALGFDWAAQKMNGGKNK